MRWPTLKLSRFDEVFVVFIATQLFYLILTRGAALSALDTITLQFGFACFCIGALTLTEIEVRTFERTMTPIAITAACGLTAILVYAAVAPTPEPVLNIILVLAVAPLVEEFIFRRLLLGPYLDCPAFGHRAISAAFLFAIFQTTAGFLIACLFGIAMAWLYRACRTTWPCIGAHVLLNLTVLLSGAMRT